MVSETGAVTGLPAASSPCRMIFGASGVPPMVADALENLTSSLILRDSEKSTLTRLAAGREIVVVTPQVSQAPVEVLDGITVPTLEKILVDILSDNALHALTGSEAYAIYSTAFDRYAVSRKTLLRYAGRRNRTDAVNTIMKEIADS